MTAARPRLLVVEDEPALQKVLAVRLQIEGFEVRAAGDGEEALAMIAEERPDLVLTDLMMPLMDGAELTRQIKGDPALKSIPVMVLTALKEQREREHLLRLGADAFAAKPYNSAELTARIRELLAGG
ncbi:MAG: two-component system, OmpR family, phosphate regulon response regulator PhoB [Chloroflexota bacterium]|jgi:two-component system phosphate regulon response regulator PhoB|nr:two-component system, OmpR family, phosphate regulon response regulator PhoB [Chloroflexota bacterium]